MADPTARRGWFHAMTIALLMRPDRITNAACRWTYQKTISRLGGSRDSGRPSNYFM